MIDDATHDARVFLEVRLRSLEDGQKRLEAEQANIKDEMRNQFNEIKLLIKEKTGDHDRRIFKLEQDSFRQKYFIAGVVCAVSFLLECARRFFGW